MSTIFIPNRSSHDYSDCERFGDRIVYLTDGRLNRFAVNEMFRLIDEALRDSSPEDLLLQTSLTTLNSLAAAYMAAKHGKVNLLLLKKDRYVKRTIVLNNCV